MGIFLKFNHHFGYSFRLSEGEKTEGGIYGFRNICGSAFRRYFA